MNATGQKDTAPKWQQHLEGVHVPGKGVRIAGAEGERTREAILAAYADGGNLREIAAYLGRSYGSVRNIVSGAGILRPRGWRKEFSPDLLPPRERAEKTLREIIASESYKPNHKLPPLRDLIRAAGVSRTTLEQVALKLQLKSLLLLVPGRGYVVIDPADPPKGDTLQVCVSPGRWENWLIGNQNVTNVAYLKKAITRQIREGAWPAGSRVPAQAAIARKFGTSRPAVRSALHLLEDRGHLVRRKRFLFVPDPPSCPSPARGIPPRRIGTAPCPPPTAEQS
ncbi:GntR family transcriptional regulator [Streptomyces sp. 4F14]|uniref:GntR family transcriptional regulator n=1 Tax=Streptomyces sp. 4F14 TaxID=3394380 RepID=UPI003A898CC5